MPIDGLRIRDHFVLSQQITDWRGFVWEWNSTLKVTARGRGICINVYPHLALTAACCCGDGEHPLEWISTNSFTWQYCFSGSDFTTILQQHPTFKLLVFLGILTESFALAVDFSPHSACKFPVFKIWIFFFDFPPRLQPIASLLPFRGRETRTICALVRGCASRAHKKIWKSCFVRASLDHPAHKKNGGNVFFFSSREN